MILGLRHFSEIFNLLKTIDELYIGISGSGHTLDKLVTWEDVNLFIFTLAHKLTTQGSQRPHVHVGWTV